MSFRVALTFDAEYADRPTRPGVQERIIETLAQAAVDASFFVQGRWAEANPETARLIVAGGHLVGNHSHYHARMTLFSERGFQADVRFAERAIKRVMGVDPRPWFRYPFGAGADSRRLLNRLGAASYRSAGWHVDTKDWHVRATGRAVERTAVEGAVGWGDGAIVLFHTWPVATLQALPAVLVRLRDAGAVFVRLDALRADELPAGPPMARG
ncbi:MAG: polysaccharide deacetylase family protein [Chloroflexota bacterium]|nr:polysaccharide deacetylase family protein [Chloroflexota bacterium]